jgi:8-oxo-dGTP pyrophosphatase MutT (NUDIX family)
VFAVHYRSVLLRYHQKLLRRLSPGGHVEPHELPKEAPVREMVEAVGI